MEKELAKSILKVSIEIKTFNRMRTYFRQKKTTKTPTELIEELRPYFKALEQLEKQNDN